MLYNKIIPSGSIFKCFFRLVAVAVERHYAQTVWTNTIFSMESTPNLQSTKCINNPVYYVERSESIRGESLDFCEWQNIVCKCDCIYNIAGSLLTYIIFEVINATFTVSLF